MRYGKFEYDLFQGVTIKKYHGEAMSLTIPSKINGSPVKRIGNRAFSGSKYLAEVTIPNSVNFIGEEAFSNCRSLRRIIIPDSVNEQISIGKGAFAGCDQLTDVYLPKSWTNVANIEGSNRKIHHYSFPSSIFSQFDFLTNTEILQRVEQIEKILNRVNYLIRLPGISNSLRNLAYQTARFFRLKNCSQKLNDSVEKIFNEIETEYNRQDEISKRSVFPPNLSEKLDRIKDLSAGCSAFLDLIKQIRRLTITNYPSDLNDSLEKTLAEFEEECLRYQEKKSVINLNLLVEKVSGKKIPNAAQYIQKFANAVAEAEERIKTNIENLEREKIAIQKRQDDQNRENESRIQDKINVLQATENA